MFFPDRGQPATEAKRICAGCEVRAECLEYALNRPEPTGIWGGATDRERRQLRRKLTRDQGVDSPRVRAPAVGRVDTREPVTVDAPGTGVGGLGRGGVHALSAEGVNAPQPVAIDTRRGWAGPRCQLRRSGGRMTCYRYASTGPLAETASCDLNHSTVGLLSKITVRVKGAVDSI